MSDDQHGDESGESQSNEGQPDALRPLRIWPAIFLLLLMYVFRSLPGWIDDGPANIWMSSAFGPLGCSIGVLIWWLLFSRASWKERVAGFAGILVALAITLMLVDHTMRGPATTVLTVPMGMAGFAITAALCARILNASRTLYALMVATCGFGFSILLCNDGLWGDFRLGLRWRFVPSPEQRMLEEKQQDVEVLVTPEEMQSMLTDARWPEFRGPQRTGVWSGPAIETDWERHPPKELWKIAVGPGWASFAVTGDLLFTQEQRGDNETTVCYQASTGNEIWTHQINGRFEDTLGGPGPRATPTVADGGLFIVGASGQVMRLNPITGEMIWMQDLREIAEREPPVWGFCSSPLVRSGVVVVHAGGEGENGTIAFDVADGRLKWKAASGDHSYSSPQVCRVAGNEYLVMLSNLGAELLDLETGQVQLSYEWVHEGYRALQPQVLGDDSLLLPTGLGAGTRRIVLQTNGEKLDVEELWTSRSLKSDFNDFVVFDGHAYGFDGAIFTCIDLSNGDRVWKGGRYGKGQVLLLEQSSALVVASERGRLILLDATPEEHRELGKLEALEGKTWNHPVVIDDKLYIRNSQQAACFELTLAAQSSPPLTPSAEPIEVSTEAIVVPTQPIVVPSNPITVPVESTEKTE